MIDLHLDIDIKSLPEEEAKKKIDGINQVAAHFYTIKNFEAVSTAQIMDYQWPGRFSMQKESVKPGTIWE